MVVYIMVVYHRYKVKHHLQQIQVPTFILNMPNRHTLNAAEGNLLGWEKILHLGVQKKQAK